MRSRSFFPAGVDGEDSEELQKPIQVSSESKFRIFDCLKSKTQEISLEKL